MVEDLSQRLKLSFDVDLPAPRKYAVTLIRAGDTLHGWRFPAEVLRRAVARFEGSSCFLNHVGWFQQAASVGGRGGPPHGQEGRVGRLLRATTTCEWTICLA